MLTPIIVVLAMLAALAGWMWFMYRRSAEHPLWMAFGATAAGVFFAATGLAGYTLNRHRSFVAQTPWVDHVIWPQVGVGVLAGLVAVYFWRRALMGR